MASRPGVTGVSAADATTGASLLRGGVWNTASRLLPQVYVLIVSVVAARFLGPDGMGRQSYIAFVALSVTTLFSGGLAVSLMRFVGESIGRGRPDDAAGLIAWGWRLDAAGAAVGGALLVAAGIAGSDSARGVDLRGCGGGIRDHAHDPQCGPDGCTALARCVDHRPPHGHALRPGHDPGARR